MIATLVDWAALWRTIWSAALAGVVVTVCCSFSVLGAARASERRAAAASPGPWPAVALVGALATLAVVAYGLSLIVG
jgi:hypothetical protein